MAVKVVIRLHITLQNLLLKLLILFPPGRETTINVIVSAPVHVKDPAKDGNTDTI